MREANTVSSVLPVSPATPLPGSSANSTAASSANNGQPAFSQVLRDKQVANADAAKAANTANAPKASKANDKPATGPKKADGDNKEASADKGDEVEAGAPARTAAELAQLLAAAGMMANASTTQSTTATAGDASSDGAADPAAKLSADPASLLPQTDKTAAASSNLAASLAANTANTTTSPAQALTTQSALSNTDNKPGAGTSDGNQQSADKQALLAIAAHADGDKIRADATTPDTSFSAALDRAGQSNGVAPGALNITAQSQATPANTHTVTTPVGRQGWAEEVGQRVLWTAKSDNSRADLVLTPAQLGRIEVSIQMNGDQANASFVAANAVAREALQDAMPRLRELMSQAGIQLGQADVSAGQSGQNSGQGERRQSGGGMGNGMLGTEAVMGTPSNAWTRSGSGMVDTFA